MIGKSTPKPGAREAALRALVRVEQDGAYLNLALPPFLAGLPEDDRSLAVQLAAGTIQRLNTLDWSINLFSHRSLTSFTPWVRNLLRLSSYQLLYLDRIPDYAVVNEAVRLAHRFGHQGVAKLVNALLRRVGREAQKLPWPDPGQEPAEYLSLRESHPKWLVDRMIRQFGYAETAEWCRANNKKPRISLRPNLLKIKSGELAERLSNEGISVLESPIIPGMLQVVSGGSPAGTRSFKEGLFTIQGESSALVAPLLALQPGNSVVDLCSAPGGKTTQMAELMSDRGRVYAVELHQHRLRLVEEAARRLGLHSISSLLADGRSIDQETLANPDVVLVDAPCTGLGVIRRLPEIKWRRSDQDPLAMQPLQLDLLTAAARLLKPGGRLLYSVCTNTAEETDDLVEKFAAVHGDFTLEPFPNLIPPDLPGDRGASGRLHLWPHLQNLDGFFIARWRKK